MVQKSLDYLIWYENELDYQKAASYFANSPYGIIYVKNKRSEAISGIITIGEVVNGMCEERLSYKSSFVYASSADEAIKLIENKINIHAVPVLDENGRLLESYQERYTVPKRFINGILLKLGNDENGDYASILRDLDINEVRLIVSLDSDIGLVQQVQNKISKRNICVKVKNFEDFLKDHIFNKDDFNVLWVDTGADYLCQRLRRFCNIRGGWHFGEYWGTFRDYHISAFCSNIKKIPLHFNYRTHMPVLTSTFRRNQIVIFSPFFINEDHRDCLPTKFISS